MKPQEISKIVQLDPNGMNGTIQQVILHPKLNEMSYADTLYHLLSETLEEKAYLQRASNAMTRVLLSSGMHSELNKCLELEEKL